MILLSDGVCIYETAPVQTCYFQVTASTYLYARGKLVRALCHHQNFMQKLWKYLENCNYSVCIENISKLQDVLAQRVFLVPSLNYTFSIIIRIANARETTN